MTELDPRRHAIRPDLADAALRDRVTAARYSAGELRRVAAATAPLRREPSAGSMLLTEALRGEAVRVFEEGAGGWSWAQLVADRYVGWIPTGALRSPAPEPNRKVSALATFAFSRPDIKSPPLATLPLGACVAVTGEAEDRNARYALIHPGGAVVLQHLAAPDHYETDPAAVAERFRGVPYLWGGKTAAGLDCSGLVQVAFNACGIEAPRDSDMQEAEMGEALAIAGGLPELRRGDLVFWPGHVGIMTGPDLLLHANAHYMQVAEEPLRDAAARMAARGAALRSVRRIAR